MKKIIVLFTVVISLSLGNKAGAQGYGSVNFNTFYNELSPYGRWVSDAQYGQVWIANEPGFEPYYDNGRWVFTSYGWTWVSDYSWGWAPFHYGRWAYIQSWGWAWVPGYEWGPAWVSWCQNDGYYGWAPMSPGYGFNASFNSIPRNHWRFVQQQYITGPSIRNHIIRPERNANVYRNVRIINNTQVNNNVRYEAGPQREAVERITRQKIETKPVAFNSTGERSSVDNREVRLYRPGIKPKQAVNNPGNAEQNKAAAVQDNRVPNNTVANPTNGKLQPGIVKPLPQANSNVPPPNAKAQEQPVTREEDRRVKPIRPTPANTNKTVVDEPAEERSKQWLKERRQDAAPQQNNVLKSDERTTRQPDAGAQQRMQQEQERRQQQAAQQEQQRRQLQLQKDQQQNDLQQQQQLQRRQQDQQKQLDLQNRQRENEQRQEQLKAQREQQQQQNMQRQNELRQQREQQQVEQRQQRLQQQQQNIQRQNEPRQQRSTPERQAPVKKFS